MRLFIVAIAKARSYQVLQNQHHCVIICLNRSLSLPNDRQVESKEGVNGRHALDGRPTFRTRNGKIPWLRRRVGARRPRRRKRPTAASWPGKRPTAAGCPRRIGERIRIAILILAHGRKLSLFPHLHVHRCRGQLDRSQ